MLHNFELASHRTKDVLHLQLMGVFDGSSACELLKVIRENGSGTSQVLVDTSKIQSVHPFGKKVLQIRLSPVSRKLIGLTFTGKHRREFEG
jgi:hypothetical protein